MRRRTYTCISTLIVFLAMGFTTHAQTIINEMTVSDSVVWRDSGSPYRILGDVSIEPGASLIVEGGSVLIFEGKFGINVGGTFRVAGENAPVRLEGLDLGNGKHILWRSIRPASPWANIVMVGANIQDAEVAIDFSGTTYQPGGPQFSCFNSNFNNNLIALKTGKQGSNFYINGSEFLNNEIAIQGNYTSIGTTTPYRHVEVSYSRFDSNLTAVQSTHARIEFSQFTNNKTAIEDGVYCVVDSCGFERNTLAFSGYGMVIERSNFFLNDKSIVHTGRKAGRDKLLRNSIIRTNHFESGKVAVFLEAGAMIEEISCNIFFKNDVAIALPDSLQNAGDIVYKVEKNIFLQNNLAIKVLELEASSPPPGTKLQPVRLIYNALAFNFVLIDLTSPNNLNFFSNYILLLLNDKYFINLTINDGDDLPGLGKVNFTISGDTIMDGSLVIVDKIEDVIKHNDYDSADVAGNTYAFEMCASPIPTSFKRPADNALHLNLYPNPCTNKVNIEWEETKQIDFSLFGITGKEIPMENANGLTSPAQFDLNHLAPGIYFLRAQMNDGAVTLKFIKE